MTTDQTHDLPPEDVELLAELRRAAAGADPEPAYLRELGRAAFSVRRVDAELAQLVADSARRRELVRSAGGDPRLVTFVAGEVTIEVQVSRADSRPCLIGLVEGLAQPQGARVAVEAASGLLVAAALDEWGRFTVEDLPPGLLRLRVAGEGVDVTTDWWSLAD